MSCSVVKALGAATLPAMLLAALIHAARGPGAGASSETVSFAAVVSAAGQSGAMGGPLGAARLLATDPGTGGASAVGERAAEAASEPPAADGASARKAGEVFPWPEGAAAGPAGGLSATALPSRFLVLGAAEPAQVRAVGLGAVYWDPIASLAAVGDHVYVIDGRGVLSALDVADPLRPAEVGLADAPRDVVAVVVAGRYGYLAAGPDGLGVVDLAEPRRPVPLDAARLPGRAMDVAVAGRYAYVASGYDGLRVVDLGVPDQPRSE